MTVVKKLLANQYFNVTQFRIDLWNELKYAANKLKTTKKDKANEMNSIESLFRSLSALEKYWAFPGMENFASLKQMFKRKEYTAFFNEISEIVRMLSSEAYRSQPGMPEPKQKSKRIKKEEEANSITRNYFETLFVDNLSSKEEKNIKDKLSKLRSSDDPFIYETLVANTFQDALIALLFNYNIQVCVIRYGIPFKSSNDISDIKTFISSITKLNFKNKSENELGLLLCDWIKNLRPELDVYYVTDTAVGDIDDEALKNFRRIFYRKEDLQEIHLSINRGIKERFETPFFTALKEYSQKPTGVFHAMPISRGNSVFKSLWINDFGEFYGRNLFLAETSATTGGLDSLLKPTGPLKKAQQLAAKAFGAQQTFFVTNGTSTGNKIVVQALIEPGDLVLIDRDCHKSHHYGLVLAGAYPVYLDSYPIEEYSMYGAVPIKALKAKLMRLKKAGRLDKVKMCLLTNCTFDGLVYNVERVMEEVLAIKSDMIFLWDEAWFAFASFTPTYKQRTAMYVADKLYKKYSSEKYKRDYATYKEGNGSTEKPMPDPRRVKVRVYATQSTHKTLSSLRQGSMIHIYDEEFKRKTEESFIESYMTHTSTSPNYQILASLDSGRRQVQFEGYEMVEKSIEMAMILRYKINEHPKLRKYFDVLTVKDFIPAEFRESGIEEYYHTETGWTRMEEAWETDEFVLDPTKINLFIGRTGVDGDTFKNKYLMDQFGIQINKTSRNSVLFMTNIGTTRSSVAYLIGALLKIAEQLDEKFKSLNNDEALIEENKIYSLTKDVPPLPHFSHFHASFQAVPGVPGGNIREAFFQAYNEKKCMYIKLEDCQKALDGGREIVSASFVIPYPPGFPILVPGQVLSPDILEFLMKLDVKEIHGYRADLGLRIFTSSALNRHETPTAMMGAVLKESKADKSKKMIQRSSKSTKGITKQ
ncbi:MAG TPA: aminotransferase class I/II-fold pyridoxal phosphate-dependent enzyme [Cyclobacteriaceae bacterium]